MVKLRHWLSCLLLSMCISYASANSIPPPNTPQGLEGGFWRIDGNFDATLRLKNILLKQSLVVTPSLYFADGTEYRLPPVTLSPAGIGRVSIRYALQNAPAAIRSHVSTFGMAAISYRWSWPAVIASIQATDEIASLTTVSSFQADMRKVHVPAEPATPQIARGTWWLPTDNADYFVALGNSSLTTKTIQIVVSGHDGQILADTQVMLNKHAVQILHLSDILGQRNAPDKLGGIEIHYSGAQRSVVSYAGIEDEGVGYSASPFLIEDRPLPARPDHLATISAPGIMLGRPDPAMLFPIGTVFSPFAILHNVSNHPLAVNIALDTQASAGAPQTRSLNSVNLAPGETLQYDLNSQFSQDDPLPDGYGTLSASFNGQDGDLRVQAGSIDQSQSYVFEAPASLQAETASRTLCFWSLEGDNDTMVAVWNYEAVAQDLVLTLHYATGQYLIPIHLEPRQAYNLDLMSLVRNRLPDPTGALIPSNIDSGSAVLSGVHGELDKIAVSVATSVFNVRNATCGYGCVTCNGEVSLVFTTSPLRVSVKKTVAATIQLTMGSGTVITNPAGTWHTSNTAVATVNSNGVHTGVSAGTATSFFVVQNIPVNTTICGPAGSVTCPDESLTETDPVDVVQPVVNVSVNPGGNIPYGQSAPGVTAAVEGSSDIGVPTGNITFSIDPAVPGVTSPADVDLFGGSASWDLGGLGGVTLVPVGAYTITAVYNGDDNYDSAQNTGVFAIAKDGSTTAITNCPSGPLLAKNNPQSFVITEIPNPSPAVALAQQPTGAVNLTATLTTGGVITGFGALVAKPGLTSTTKISISLNPGTYTITASYQSDGNYESSSASCPGGVVVQ